MLRVLGSLVRGGQTSCSGLALASSQVPHAVASLEATTAGRLLGNFLGRTVATSSSQRSAQDAPAAKHAAADAVVEEPPRKYRSLEATELWHEAWMYEDHFGTETDPVIVPSTEGERIIGVTDPDDENLVVWGVLKASDPPRQFVEGGEFYVLSKVPYVKKVGDVIEELEGSKTALAR